VIGDHSSTEFRDVLVKIHQKFRLLSIDNIIEVNVFVSPFKVMDDPSVSQLLLHYEKVLKELNDVFLDVNVRVLCNHGRLLAS
jgi:hypothetical protein